MVNNSTNINKMNDYLSPEIIEQQLPLTWTHWTTTTSHLKSLNNNYLSPEIIEHNKTTTKPIEIQVLS
jgi:beta-xylosidase